jgi:hypothetical protein
VTLMLWSELLISLCSSNDKTVKRDIGFAAVYMDLGVWDDIVDWF